MKKRNFLSLALLVALPGSVCFYSPVPASAQNARPADGAVVKISACVVEGEWGGKTGLRLEGCAGQSARISHPQLDVAAPKIEVGFDDKRQFTKVTAAGGVNFAVTMPQKDGPATRIEAKCNNATLERAVAGANAGARVLTLRGGVDGWYQVVGGMKNTLRGESVILTSRPGAAEALMANIEGGADGVRIELPPPPAVAGEPTTVVSNRGPVIIAAQSAVIRQQKDGIRADVEGGTRGVRLEIRPADAVAGTDNLLNGAVVVTARRAVVRQSEGTARFIGDAHAVSTGTAQKFDVAAEEISLARNASGDFDFIKTVGRAKVKLDLRQDKAVPAPEKATSDKASLRPEYLEVEADSAVATLVKSQLVFAGNVRGFYRLPAQNVGANPAVAPKENKFSGDRAVLIYKPGADDPAQRWNFAFYGLPNAPVEIDVPVQLDDF